MKLLLYSPDSYGLGHVRRSISLAQSILDSSADASGLLLTGAPRAHYFDYPERCDYLKLPSITKDHEGRYISRDLAMEPEKVIRLREGVIWLAAASFSPDVFLVDHSPLGIGGEVVPTLMRLAAGPEKRTLRVLGMRDIIDDPMQVRRAWKRDGVLDVLRDHYDLILVYGSRDVYDVVDAYGIPSDIEKKMRFVGYIPRHGDENRSMALRAQYAPRTGRLVVVALGGGGDGNRLLSTFTEGYQRLNGAAPFEVVAVTGPLMSSRKRRRFTGLSQEIPGLSVLEYTGEMPELFRAADLAVSMGGYNTVCELACAGTRALLSPRTFPRREQWLRGQILEQRGVASCIDPESLSPDTLMTKVLHELGREQPACDWGLPFDGLERSVECLTEGLESAQRSLGATVAWGRC